MTCDPRAMTVPGDIPTALFEPAKPREGDVDLRGVVHAALEMLDCSAGLTVLANDPQRETNTHAVLAELAAQVDPAGIRILVATGSHSFCDDQRESFAGKLAGDLPLKAMAWHDCRGKNLAPIGPGGQWLGHRWLTERPALLAIGSVKPHYFAGFTGAHKTATIGCASFADITANHAMALEPQCRPCRLDGNPVHAGIGRMLEALWRDRPLAAINLVQVGGRVAAALAGRPMQTLRQAAEKATGLFVRRVERTADAIIAEVTGPLGETFYQAEKAIKNNEWAVRDAGTIILVAPCRRGIGQDQFLRLLREADSYDQAVALVNQNGYQLGDHKAVRLRYLTGADRRGVQVSVVSGGLAERDAKLLGVLKFPAVEDALSAAGLDARSDRIYHIKDAGNMCILPHGLPWPGI